MGEPTTRDTDALVGRTFGEFVVREPLSRGGFGMVFRAEQPALAREAVIKVLHTRLQASGNLAQRFLREARLASLLDHPYAAHTYAFGVEPDGVLWIAMELVRGTPLDKLLAAQGPIPLERFVPLLERICEVVHTAHEQGIVHRDIKPGNVMVLSRAGRLLPKLLDLGIAKLAGGETSAGRDGQPPPAAPLLADPPRSPTSAESPATPPQSMAETLPATDTPPGWAPTQIPPAPGTVWTVTPAGALDSTMIEGGDGRLTLDGTTIGSPMYMAPEQWADASAVSSRTDIYALGVLSYEALTGRNPFRGRTPAMLAQAHARQPPPPLGGELPRALDAVLARAMAKLPEDRHASALELAAAFRAASGVVADAVALPRLDDRMRATVLADAPQPLAQAVAALDSARNAHQARDALWQVVRVVTRLVGVIALAGHSHVGFSPSISDSAIGDALRNLRGRGVGDAGWLEIARELAAPFAALRDAYPVPELFGFLLGDGAAAQAELLALRSASEEAGGGSDEQVRELLTRAMPLVTRVLAAVSFLGEYRLVVPGEGGAEVWRGVRGARRSVMPLRGAELAAARPALTDAAGVPVVSLWPFVQVHVPAPGEPEALFFFEGKGRRGARLVALPEAFEHEDEELWELFGGLLRDQDHTTGSSAIEERCPFPGLAAFTREDAATFFGRERETEAFVNLLRVAPLVAVVGPSGAGKSSFVQAGVIPALPEGWQAITVRPGPAPLASLASRLEGAGVEVGDLRAALAADPRSLGVTLRAHAAARGNTLVIVVDQLEELFTLSSDAEERALYAEALAGAARSVDDPVRLILGVRDDFLLEAEALPALTSRLGQAMQLLTTPAEPELRRILVEPVRRSGYEFEDPSLPDEMVREVAGERGALALLSFTAGKLWELRDRRFRHLGRKAYVSLGGIGGSLAQHAEATLQAMPPEEQGLVREVFRHAVTAEGTRAVMSRAELVQVLGGGPHEARVIEKLLRARLLAVSEGEDGADMVEITHEALLEAWPRLVGWRRQDAEGARLRDQLRAAARQWDARGRTSGLLWRGDTVDELRLWRARFTGALTAVEEAFAAASLAEATRERRLRRNVVVGVVTALVLGLVGMLLLNARASRQRERAEDAQARALASQSVAEDGARKLTDLLRSQYENQGRRLILADDPLQGLAYLSKAASLGAQGPAHDLLIAEGLRATEGELFQVRHDSSIVRARFSPDGQRLATAGYDNKARLWDARDGRQLAVLEHDGPVRRVEFSPDGSMVVTSSSDDTAGVWSTASGRLRRRLGGHAGGVQSAIFSPDGASLVTVNGADGVRLWSPATGELVALLRPPGHTVGNLNGSPCAFSPDGKLLAVGDDAGTVRLWRVSDRKQVGVLEDRHGRVVWVTFAPDSGRIAITGDDGVASLWSVARHQRERILAHKGGVASVAFSPDGSRVVTAGHDRTAVVWDTSSGDQVMVLSGHVAAVVLAMYSPDGKQIVTASDDATVQLWDASNGRRLARRLGHRGVVGDVAFSPGGDHMVSASIDGTAIVWTTAPQDLFLRLRGHDGTVHWAEFSHDGAHVVTAGHDGTARIWDTSTGKELLVLRGHRGVVYVARFSPDDRQVATTGDDQTVRIWDASSGAVLQVLGGATRRVQYASWSPDGTRVATASDDGTVRVWSVADGSSALTIPIEGKETVFSVNYDPTGAVLVTTANDNMTRVLDARTGEQRAAYLDPDARWRASFDRTGKLVLSCTFMQDAKIWRLDDGKAVNQLVGHVGDVLSCQWSPDDELAVTASLDGNARIWDPADGSLLAVVKGPGEEVWSGSFSPDGRRVVLATDDGGAIWDLPRFDGGGDELDRLIRCRVPYMVEGERSVSRPRDIAACAIRPARR